MDKLKRGALMALLKAARELNEAYRTGVGIGACTHRHHLAVEATAHITVADLDGPEVPDHVALHGGDLEAFLDSVTHMGRDRTLVHALELKLDQEGLHVRINGRGGWSSGLGEPRGSQ